ncbi:hypothetical protein [Robbsia andropogonis]|uniref:hypothetical protein n=1 Tax=Robbsia andropogonis TaxID=28092 RepID=UPI0004654161|nr:hypothetical protein [Robbsia andropogonis]
MRAASQTKQDLPSTRIASIVPVNHVPHRSRRGVAALTMFAALGVLTACSSKQDASSSNFSTALGRYLEVDGDLCLNVGRFPVDISEGDLKAQPTTPDGPAAEMAALQRTGLVSSVDVLTGELAYVDRHLTGRRAMVRRYTLTTAGRDALRKIVGDEVQATGKRETERSDLCYGKIEVDKVIDWDGPTTVDGRKEAVVHYTYQVNQVAEWAKTPTFGAAFPEVQNTLNGAGEARLSTTMVLGKEGWAAKGAARPENP